MRMKARSSRVLVAAVAVAAATLATVAPRAETRSRTRHRERFDKAAEAQRFFAMKRVPAGETAVPSHLYALARRQASSLRLYSSATGAFVPRAASSSYAPNVSPYLPNIGTWSYLGPDGVGGRTRALVLDPNFAANQTMWAAGVAGGVFKSTDGGASWTAKDSGMSNLAVSTLAIDPFNSAHLLAGTGEGVLSVDPARGVIDAVRGDGIFASTDGGETWAQLAATAGGGAPPNTDFQYVNKIAFSPQNQGYIYAATLNGLRRSTDGGTTWTTSQQSPRLKGFTSGGCTDIAIRSDVATDSTLVSCGILGTQAIVFLNTDAKTNFALTNNWNVVLGDATHPGDGSSVGTGRTSLAIAPSSQTTVYALAASDATAGNFVQGLQAVFRSTDGGSTWTAQVKNTDATKLNTLLLTNPLDATKSDCGTGSDTYSNQGWYDNVIAVDPADPNRVWAGGIDLFRSDDGGVNWGLASYWWDSAPSYAHADHHVIAFDPAYDGTSNKTMFVGNDGGVFKTNDARAATATGALATCSGTNSSVAFSSLDTAGLGITQFYSGAVFPTDDAYLGGTQDNGTLQGDDGSGPSGWTRILEGDGGAVAVDPSGTKTLYAENTYGAIQKSTDGGGTFTDAVSGISDAFFLYFTPFVMDPSNSQRLWTGGSALWRTADGASSWSKASATLPKVLTATGYVQQQVTALAVAPSDGNYVLAGTVAAPNAGGRIYRTTKGLTTTGGTAWSYSAPAAGWVSSVAFDPTDKTKKTVYATYSTFKIKHVWKSTDGGATWATLDGTTFPDVPAHSIVVDPTNSQHLYVGTDIGVLVSVDGGANWAQENTGFTNVITEHLLVNGANLYGFTHGRGVWRVGLTSAAQTVVVEFGTPGSSVTESVGTVQIPVTVLTSDHATLAAPVTIDYATANGTALSGNDYVATSGTLSFPAGTANASVQSIGVPVIDDTVVENPETFTVNLSNPSGALLGTSTHTVTISDNMTIQFKQGIFSVGEAATKAVIYVTRGEKTNAGVTVNYATSDGTATSAPGGDYTATTGTLSFAPGVTTLSFGVPLTPDIVHEGNESFLLALSSAAPPAELGVQRTAVVTIVDNDPAPTIQFSASAYSVTEGPSVSAKITVVRSSVTTLPVTVQYTTVDGTATSLGDYTATSGTLSFAAGVTSTSFLVPVLDDAIAEPVESLGLTLYNPGGGAILGARSKATLTIKDNDSGIAFGAPAFTVSEGMSKAVITVKRTAPLSQPATVSYAVADGTAQAGLDYAAAAIGTLSFNPGVASQTFAVTILPDTLDEGSETVDLALTGTTGAATLLKPSSAVLTILDNEPVVQFSSAKYSGSEPAGTGIGKATITVRRLGNLTGVVHVNYATSAGTAAPGVDYNDTSGQLTFNSGVTSQTFPVALLGNTLDKPNPTVNLTLSQVDIPLGTPSTSLLTIADNDLAGKVQFAAPTFSGLASSGSILVTVTRTNGIASGATVHYSTADGSALQPGDYTTTTGTLVFAAGETKKFFSVPVNPVFGPNKSFSVTLDSPGGNLKLGTPTSAAVWIVE